ncbi:zinc-binding dehydrogenase [Rhodococcus rhodnii]|uniref:zinc-binding dehydrogenase n=1 Tax=Rhodococcus rhodnii TaxID=38312 RepID=UPI001479726C|nr:zinc-binding dehydrogenase [Rhodococcus rhodnii]
MPETRAGHHLPRRTHSETISKPDELDSKVAAALPVAGEAALRALAHLGLQRGETLLVLGAAGGVGTIATQLAIAAGAKVVATAGEANHERLRALGAAVTTYGDGQLDRIRALAPHGVDAVLSASATGALGDAVELRGGTTGRIASLADTSAFELGIDFLAGTPADRSRETLRTLVSAWRQGRLVLPPARRFALHDAVAAHRELDHGHGTGKIVLVP